MASLQRVIDPAARCESMSNEVLEFRVREDQPLAHVVRNDVSLLVEAIDASREEAIGRRMK
jgi:hypothetical protein